MDTYTNDSAGTTEAKTWFTYDANWNLSAKTAWLSGGTNPVITYDYTGGYGNPVAITDARGDKTTISYDSTFTYPVSTTNALNQTSYITYDPPMANR